MPIVLCSSCQSEQPQQLVLDCTHYLCLPCLSRFLQTTQEQEEMLNDELEIVCPTCSHRTALPIPLAYKLVRDVASRSVSELICLDCKAGLFSVSDYTSGQHRGHLVKTVDSALPMLCDEFEGVRIQLKQSVQNLQRQCDRLYHQRVLLDDIVTANVHKIRASFMNLKEEIARKQIEVLDSYQDVVEGQIMALNSDIQKVQEEVARGEEYLRWIEAEVQERGEKGYRLRDKTEIAEYYLKHHHGFDQFVAFEQGIRKRVPSHLEIVKMNRDIIKIDVFEPVIALVRQLSLIEAKEQTEPEVEDCKKAVSGLGPDYFDAKRQELHGSIFKTTQPRVKGDALYQRQQLWRQMNYKPDSSKKRAVKIPQGKRL